MKGAGVISLFLMAGGVSLALLFPALPEVARQARGAWQNRPEDSPALRALSPEKLELTLKDHPGDAFLRLALGQYATALLSTNPPAPQSEEAARQLQALRGYAGPAFVEQVLSRYPDSAAAHLYLAVRLINKAAGVEGAVSLLPSPSPLLSHLKQPTDVSHRAPPSPQEQLDCLIKAEEQLVVVEEMEGWNAAPDFLLAHIYLTRGDDFRAEQALKSALTRSGWSLHSPELRQALVTLYDEGGLPSGSLAGYVRAAESAPAAQLQSSLFALAQYLLATGESYRNAGGYEDTIYYYRAVAHLGHVVLTGAESISDGRNAATILRLLSDPFATPEEKEKAAALRQAGRSQAGRIAQLLSHTFMSYLGHQGYSQLAMTYRLDLEQAERFELDALAAEKKIADQAAPPFSARGFLVAAVGWFYAAYALVLLALLGAGWLAYRSYLIFRPRRRSSVRPSWRWWQWAVLLGAVIAPGFLWALAFYPNYQAKIDHRLVKEVALGCALLRNLALLGLAALPAAPLLRRLRPALETWWKNRRRPTEEQVEIKLDKAELMRAWLTDLTALLPISLAVLLGMALLLSWPPMNRLDAWAAQQEQILRQGEVSYWKIGAR